MPLGFSFQPGQDAGLGAPDQPGPGQAKAPGASPQQAVKILSLRVPPALPSNAPVNRALLTAPGSAGPGGDAFTAMVQQLMQAFKPQTPTPTPQVPPQTDQYPQSQAPRPMPTLQEPLSASPGAPPPLFEGNIDTPPTQNAPSLFTDPPAQTYQNPNYDEFGNSIDWFNAPGSYSPGLFASAPQPPMPRFIVDKDPGGGGSFA